jgi:hypothetical protein
VAKRLTKQLFVRIGISEFRSIGKLSELMSSAGIADYRVDDLQSGACFSAPECLSISEINTNHAYARRMCVCVCTQQRAREPERERDRVSEICEQRIVRQRVVDARETK